MGCGYSSQQGIVTVPSEQFIDLENMDFQIPHTFDQFLNLVKKQINQEVYNSLLEKQYLQGILHEFERYYVTHQNAVNLLELLVNYMAFAKNYYKGKNQLPSTMNKNNFTVKFAEEYLKIKNQIFFSNKDILKIFNYICPLSNKSEYDHSYLDLKFDLSIEEVRKVTKVVKEMFRIDMRSFIFLTNYLLKSCYNLEAQGQSIKEVQNSLIKTLQILEKQNPPAPPLDGPQHLMMAHQTFKHPFQHSGEIVLHKAKKEIRAKLLDEFIAKKAQQSVEYLPKFNQVVKQHCSKTGFHFRSCVKLKSLEQTKSVQRIKQKILTKNFQKYSIDKELSQNQKTTIEKFTKTEVSKYDRKMKQFFESVKQPLKFNVSDMLRGKCMFSDVTKINQCCSQIKRSLQASGFQLLQVDNRLKNKTSDLVLKILIGQTVAQLQLAIDLNVPAYEFNHKIYELIRSKFFTPLTMLKHMNQDLANNFIREVNKIIKFNLAQKNDKPYGQKITFKELKPYFDEFTKTLTVKIDQKGLFQNQIDIDLMENLMKKFHIVKHYQTLVISQAQRKYNNGLFKFAMKDYKAAQTQLLVFCTIFQREFQSLLEKVKQGTIDLDQFPPRDLIRIKQYCKALQQIGLIHREIGKAEKAIEWLMKYETIYKNIPNSQVELFKNQELIAQIYNKEGKYHEAFKYYKQILDKKNKHYGERSIEVANTLNNIGLFHKNFGKYPQALEFYFKSLSIKQELTGKESFECAITIQNIGNVYKNTQQYPKALKEYNHCLDIQEKMKGKTSIQCASTLDNLGVVMRATFKLTQALHYHKRAAQIIETVLGKNSNDLASVLNNIGFVYRLMLKFDQSFKYHKRALQIKQEIKGKGNIDLTNIIMNIGVALALQGKLEEALQYHKRAAKIRWTVEGQKSHAAAQNENQVGYVYQLMGKYDLAMQSYTKCLKVYVQIKTKKSVDWSITAVNVGTILTQQGKYEQALSYLLDSADNFLKIKGRTISYGAALYPLGRLYHKMNKIDESIEVLSQAFKIFNNTEYKEFRLGQICTALGDIYSQKGDYKNAIYYYDQAPKLKVFEWSYMDNLKKKAQCHKKYGHIDLQTQVLKQLQRGPYWQQQNKQQNGQNLIKPHKDTQLTNEAGQTKPQKQEFEFIE